MRTRPIAFTLAALLLPLAEAWAGSPSRWKTTATVRSRLEVYDFFEPGNVPLGRQNEYAFFGNLLRVGFF